MQALSGIPDINPEQMVELIEQIHDAVIKFHTLFDKVCIFSESFGMSLAACRDRLLAVFAANLRRLRASH